MRCARPRRFWLAIACTIALFAGCAAEPKRPAGKTKSKPVATASKSTAKPAAKPKLKSTAPKTAPAKIHATKDPDTSRTPKERYAEALELVRTSRWQDAERTLAAYVKEFPQHSGPHTNLGIVYARTNRKPLAGAAFAAAVRANPDNAAAHTWLGVLARETGDLKQAEMSYRRALAADLKYPAAHLNLAILYDQYLRRPRDALVSYQRYRELAGADDLRAAVWVAELESKLKQPATATP